VQQLNDVVVFGGEHPYDEEVRPGKKDRGRRDEINSLLMARRPLPMEEDSWKRKSEKLVIAALAFSGTDRHVKAA
jgi:hypothetical protein